MIYAKALKSLRQKLRDADITMHLKRDDESSFWSSSSSSTDKSCQGADEIVEAVFVDDECIFISASFPQKLDYAIDYFLKSIISIFNSSGFRINWSKGKTEAFVKYRGKSAAQHMRNRCVDGVAQIALPSGALPRRHS